jgi:cytochrome b
MSDPAGEARRLAWDLPARVCHWGFALSLTAGLVLAFRHPPGSEWFSYHMPLGLLAGWFAAVRLVLGFCGCALSRWRAALHPPRIFVRYFCALLRGRNDEPAGLNPGTALFAPALLLVFVGLMASGFVQDWVEAWHEPLAWVALGLVASHLLGLALHAWRHRAPTPLAMIHGRRLALAGVAPAAMRRGWGVALAAASLLLAAQVWRGFDSATSTLALPLLPEVQFPVVQKG